MEIRELTLEAFAKAFPTLPCVFCSAQFNALNASKASGLKAMAMFDGSTPVCGQIFGLREDMWEAPFSAPYSLPSGILQPDFYEKVAESVSEPLELIWPSPIYTDITHPEGTVISEDVNFHYPLSKFANYEANLTRRARNHHRNALKHPFQLAKTENIAEAYAVFEYNHRVLGYRLAMSLQQVLDTVKIIPAEFFTLSLEGTVVAAAMLYNTAPGIMQVINWADLPEYRANQSMQALAYLLFQHYANERPDIHTIDLGPASVDGVRNEGLCKFKASLGALPTPKFTIRIRDERREMRKER